MGHARPVPTVAETLRRGREAKGLTIYQVAERTKIKTEHVRALEDGQYTAFAAPIFIKGFVRNYASILKLDVPAIMAALEAELAQTDKFREPPSLTGEPHGWVDLVTLQLSKVNWRWVAPVFILAALVAMSLWGYRAWRSRPVSDPLLKLGAGIYQPASNLPAPTLPLPAAAPGSNSPARGQLPGKAPQ
jgi:cytoskeleton protein RodZ